MNLLHLTVEGRDESGSHSWGIDSAHPEVSKDGTSVVYSITYPQVPDAGGPWDVVDWAKI